MFCFVLYVEKENRPDDDIAYIILKLMEEGQTIQMDKCYNSNIKHSVLRCWIWTGEMCFKGEGYESKEHKFTAQHFDPV
jgi:hypothetical protein